MKKAFVFRRIFVVLAGALERGTSMIPGRITGLAIVLLFALQVVSHPREAHALDSRKLGIGVQSAPFPLLGLSVQYHPSSRVGLQVFGKTGYDVDNLAFRLLCRFNKSERTRWYGSALIGVTRDSHVTRTLLGYEETDTARTLGAGIGVEHFFTSTSRFAFNTEIDYAHTAFEKTWLQYDYDTWSLVMLGLGIHYYLWSASNRE